MNDFYEYNVDTESWQEVIFCGKEGPPTPRHSHSAVVYEDCMYVFGGYDGSYKNDFYKFNFTKNQWSRIKPIDEIWPTPRYRTSCTVVDEKMYMFGGHDGQQQLNDFYYYNFMKRKWNLINYSKSFEPSPRDSHILTHSDNSILLFGGSSGWAKSDFYQFDFHNEREWKSIKHDDGIKPSWRFCHVGAVVNDKLYIFGGYDGKIRLNDFYFFVISKEKDFTFNSMLKFVNNPQYSDVILEFHEEESCEKSIFAHRLLLSKYPYFEELIDKKWGYDESIEESQNFMEVYSDEWYGISTTQKSIQSVKISTVKSDESYPEEEKEIAMGDIDESKSDIEFTEEVSFKESSYTEKIPSEPPCVEDYLSEEDECELPLRIEMKDISYETWLDIIRYIYTDYWEVLLENAMKLLKAANEFKIYKLKDLCERKISSSINAENSASIYTITFDRSETLKEMSLDYIVKNFDIVSKTNGFLKMVTEHPELAVEVLKRR